ncbi:MAG: hypothetical protein E6G89_11995 [Alphaproteobacteria bacterium]|nr:MAG: hypothetical protein E6G89_11995 [Alphaproteobacteria bacterium]TMJ40047.1 MAG: hypothetical protein E6G87_02935 [Alphaproteobacteria bacterium]
MFETVTIILGIAVGIALAVRLVMKFLNATRKRRVAPDVFFAKVKPLIEGARYEGRDIAGYPQLVGRYRGLPVRLHPVIDTLAIRKLPSLWLLATIPEPLPLKATFDLMMRPAGPTTFSNFDHLPATLDSIPDLPPHAVVRTDDPDHVLPHHVVASHLDVFQDPRAKELLITAKGVRLVWQLAEGDRVRYGIFRQADFGEIELDPLLVRDLLERLIALRQSILQWSRAL